MSKRNIAQNTVSRLESDVAEYVVGLAHDHLKAQQQASTALDGRAAQSTVFLFASAAVTGSSALNILASLPMVALFISLSSSLFLLGAVF
ncbi:MAG: hypothetical protein ABW199_09190, partial [Caulobacterales bacterium]